jgi:glyoxylase-like metal-dependent hydrolase (beta-lactamase superfamily II)
VSETTETTQRWKVGQTRVTCVLEAQTDHVPPDFFFATVNAEMVRRHDWLRPHYADDDGNLGFRVQALVLEAGRRTIVVDPCVGNHRDRSSPFWNQQDWPFMERFLAAGFDPADVDLVVHTHLHVDHVGWGTQLVDGHWVPTFPNARYLYVDTELAELRASDDPDAQAIYADSIAPIVDAGLADTITADSDLGDGLRLASTPGHTVGHVVLWIESGSERALVTGDVVHHPLQLAEPTARFVSDADPDLAESTRHDLFRQVADSDVLTFGSHFATLPAGHVVTTGPSWRFDPVTD